MSNVNFPPRRVISGLILSLLIIASFAAAARAQSALDGFDPNANGTVDVIVVQPDGKILIGGDFTSLSPNGGATVTRNRIARLNPDGTLDASFDPNANNTVSAIAVQADGKILVGGLFSGASSIGGATRNRIARLDAVTGAADPFDPNANGQINAIVVQPDGKILVAGAFFGASSIGGQTRNDIARLDPATGVPDSFDPNANQVIRSIALQADGKVVAAGLFTTIGGQPRNRIARLDAVTGLADSFDPNSVGQVYAVAVQADGKILAGGAFFGTNTIGGQTRNDMARLDPVTGLADSFDPHPNNTVRTIAVQPDGKILAGGAFTTVSPNGGAAVTRSRIARLNPDGTADSFDPNASNGTVFAITVQPDRKVLAGGNFAGFAPNGGSTVTRVNIVRLETDGLLDQTLDLALPSAGSAIVATAFQPDGKILIGGAFTTILGVTRNHIARLNTDGTLDTNFDPNVNSYVDTIAVQPDGKILVGGNFNGASSVGGQTRNRIARLNSDGTLDAVFNPNADNTVQAIALQADGKVLVGGIFNVIGGQTRIFIARLDAVTGAADPFNPNIENNIGMILVQADGKILINGGFFQAMPRHYLTRLNTDGTGDSFNPLIDSNVDSIAIQADGKVLAGGLFTTAAGQVRNHVARLDATTGLPDTFDPNANSFVESIAVQADGRMLMGGFFSETHGTPTIGGQTRNHIARLNPNGTADSFDPNADNNIESIAVQADGKPLVSGPFTRIGGQTRTHFARLTNDTAALQYLAATQTSVAWSLGGSSPQFTRVTFEVSTDNVNYNFLGSGTASGSDWTLSGLSLSTAQNIYIRARGYYYSGDGDGNSSESIQESVRNAFLTAGPTPTTTATNPPTATATPTTTPTNTQTNTATATSTPTPAPCNYDVTNTNDSGSGSLRQALLDGRLCGAQVTVTFAVTGTITLSSQLDLQSFSAAHGFAINGPGPDQLVIDGNHSVSRVFAITDHTTATISGLTIANGASYGVDNENSAPEGGLTISNCRIIGNTGPAIFLFTQQNLPLTVNNSTISNNSAVNGAGIYIGSTAGPVTINNSAISGNSASGAGGGIWHRTGTLTIDNSTISGNTGGGIYNTGTASADTLITNSTISGNNGFGIYCNSSGNNLVNLTIKHCTFSGNSSGGITNTTLTGVNTIGHTVFKSGASGASIDAHTVNSLGYNLSDDNANGFLTGTGDQINTEPILGPLQNNGGPTLTHALLPGSPAIDTGNPSFMQPPDYDQRGSGFARVANGRIDKGAFEVQTAAMPSISGTITYGNAIGTPTPRFVSNVTITAQGSPTVFTTTDFPGGNYTLTGFGAGSYTVTPSKTGGVNGAISSFDAGRIALHVAGPPNPQLTANQLIVADVSGNGSVTSFDAGMIAKFVAGPPYAAPGIGSTATWRFIPTNRNYPSITGPIAGENYSALLMGEVSGNWTNTGARSAATMPPVSAEEIQRSPAGSKRLEWPAKDIAVDLPRIAAPAGMAIVVPVRVSHISSKDVISYEFDLKFDPSVIQPDVYAADVAGTVSRGLSVVTNASEPGMLRVVLYGAMAIDEDGVLLNLRFTAVGKPATDSSLHFERIMFNEGEPGVAASAGRVEIF